MTSIHLHDEVRTALHEGRPVVALETAVLTCGLPTTPWHDAHGHCPDAIDVTCGVHLALAQAMEAAVRAAGAVPATCGVFEGRCIVGLDADQLSALAVAPAAKAAPESLAVHVAQGRSAGTTVGGTLRLIEAAAASDPPIRAFATGGIGGVHQNWQQCPDVSADLATIARVPCAVVCAGAKSILDLPATGEALQTLGVPVLGAGCDRMPAFFAAGDERMPAITPVDDPVHVARSHWQLGGGGVVIMQPPPAAWALPLDEATRWADEAEATCNASGSARTPALLSGMATASDGRTLRCNIELLLANARLAATMLATG